VVFVKTGGYASIQPPEQVTSAPHVSTGRYVSIQLPEQATSASHVRMALEMEAMLWPFCLSRFSRARTSDRIVYFAIHGRVGIVVQDCVELNLKEYLSSIQKNPQLLLVCSDPERSS